LNCFVERVKSLRFGDGPWMRPRYGAMQQRAQIENGHELRGDGKTEGAKLLTGGDRLKRLAREGWFYRPTDLAILAEKLNSAGGTLRYRPVVSVFPIE